MNVIKLLGALTLMLLAETGWAQSTGHIGHGGGGGDSGCIKAKISRIQPEHLATVAPGAEFSFAASGSNGPGHIHVSILQQPVDITVEDKETFYLVKGKLPADIRNKTIRVSVQLKAKYSKCDAEGGWLLKVSE